MQQIIEPIEQTSINKNDVGKIDKSFCKIELNQFALPSFMTGSQIMYSFFLCSLISLFASVFIFKHHKSFIYSGRTKF